LKLTESFVRQLKSLLDKLEDVYLEFDILISQQDSSEEEYYDEACEESSEEIL